MTDDGPGSSGLDLDIAVRRGGFDLEVAISIEPGTVTALVGPNGAGKSTALRVAAGLVAPGSGRITLGDRTLDDPRRGIRLPPAERRIGVVFQDYLLFPHLDAADNVAFGLVARGRRRADARARAREWLTGWGLGEIADRRPSRLSGGQAQRVALARALILEPALLLLDEPLAALDSSTRLDVRADLAVRLRAFGGATLLVTHDPVDALALADELVVLDRGRIVQRGTPTEVADAPANAYIAGLLGSNWLPDEPGRPVVFSPARARISVEEPLETRFRRRCTVVGVEDLAGRIVLLLATAAGDRVTAEITAGDYVRLRPIPGARVWLAVSRSDIR